MTDTRTETIADRFARETRDHEMTVLHNEGLYRHLRFAKPGTGLYRFDLITVPGTLIFQGDGESFVFSRLPDMFEFFRKPSGWNRDTVNVDYWAEKITSSRAGLRQYDENLFVTRVTEAFVDAARDQGVPAGTGAALRRDVLDEAVVTDEADARRALELFEYEGFDLRDLLWEPNAFHNWNWWLVWACHAIQWGITQYDNATAPVLTAVAAPIKA